MLDKQDFLHRLREGQRGWLDIPAFMEAIRNMRKAVGLTQKDLAKLLDTSPAMVSRYERGLSSPGHWQLVTLSWLFGLDIGYFHYVTVGERDIKQMIDDELRVRDKKVRGAK